MQKMLWYNRLYNMQSFTGACILWDGPLQLNCQQVLASPPPPAQWSWVRNIGKNYATFLQQW